MKRIAIIATAALLFSSAMAVAAPLGVEASVEAETGDLVNDDDITLELSPALTYTIGETGLSLGVDWAAPVTPDVYSGYVEFSQEYAADLGSVALVLTNANTVYIDPEEDTDGIFTAEAAWQFLFAGLDTTYIPDLAFDFYAGPCWSFGAGPGTLDLSAQLNIHLYEDAAFDSLEATAAWGQPMGPLNLDVEVTPVLANLEDDPEFGCSALVGISYAF